MNQLSESSSPKNVDHQKPSYLEYESFIQRLRNEGNDLKDCFTKFTFQAILFTAGALGLIGTLGFLGYNNENANISEEKVLNATLATILICIPVTQILQTVVRIGLYKYGSSNRHFGYQLYLENKGLSRITWDDLNWEIRMIAWRVLQPTIFGLAYKVSTERYTSKDSMDSIVDKKVNQTEGTTEGSTVDRKTTQTEGTNEQSKNCKSSRKQKPLNWLFPTIETERSELNIRSTDLWWKIKSFERGRSDYHAGSYLRRMSIVLTILTYFTFIVMSFAIYNAWCFANSTCITSILTVVIGVWSFYLVRNTLANNRRRAIIESEMLSIHGCSEVWSITDRVLSTWIREKDSLLKHISLHASKFTSNNILEDWSKYFDNVDT